MKKVIKKIAKEMRNEIIAKENKPEMISYEMKMVIPTGQYANIQPCIIVKGGSIEEAHDFVAPHMNKLWKEYFMISERPTKITPPNIVITDTLKNGFKAETPTPVAPEAPKITPEQPDGPITPPPAPASAVASNKATQAVASCMSREALDLIATQVEKSVKLDENDKIVLRKMIAEKVKDFDEKSK